MSKFVVYFLHNDQSDHVYIGKSVRGLSRSVDHGSPRNVKKHPNFPVVQWIKKLRKQNLNYSVSVLEECFSADALSEAEKFYIAYFKSIGVSLLNCTDGGDGAAGRKWSVEQRDKMIKALTGKKHSPEHCENISASRKGYQHSDEARAKMSEARKGQKKSVETRARMSAYQKDRSTTHKAAQSAALSKRNKERPDLIEHMRYLGELAAKVNRGRKKTKEQVEKTASAHRGKKRSAETCARIQRSRWGFSKMTINLLSTATPQEI